MCLSKLRFFSSCRSRFLIFKNFFTKIQRRSKESGSDSLTWRVFVKRLKNVAERVCFDRFKITNVTRNIFTVPVPCEYQSCDGYFILRYAMKKPTTGVRSVILGGKKKNNIVPVRWAPKYSLTLFPFLYCFFKTIPNPGIIAGNGWTHNRPLWEENIYVYCKRAVINYL